MSKWYEAKAPHEDIVISSRIRLSGMVLIRLSSLVSA